MSILQSVSATSVPRALLLDWGGVLCEDPAPGFAAWCAPRLGVSPEDLGRAWVSHLDFFQRGAAESEFWERVCADLGVVAPGAPLWRAALAAVYVPQLPIIAMARRVRAAGAGVGLLTNTEFPARDFHLSLGYDFFDARVFSCDDAIAKPDPEIYLLAARRLGLPPQQVLLLDDREVNLAGARVVGMQAFRYPETESARAEVRAQAETWLLEPCPPQG